MGMLETFNPVLWIFLSYGLGALGTGLIRKFGDLGPFENYNFISDRLTKQIGVLKLGWLIRHSFMGKFNQKIKFHGKFNKDRLDQLRLQMTLAENSHLIAFVLLQTIFMSFVYFGIPWWQIVSYSILNVIFNMYLVFLQQYNKRRIERMIGR